MQAVIEQVPIAVPPAISQALSQRQTDPSAVLPRGSRGAYRRHGGLLDAPRGEQESERDQHGPQRQSETQIHDKLHVLLPLSLDHCLLGALSSPVTPERTAGTANTVRAASIRAWTRIA